MANLVEEVPQDLDAGVGVADFGMELQSEHGPIGVADGCERASIGGRERDKIAVHALHLVAVAHPDDGFVGHAREQTVRLVDPALGPAKFPFG